MSLERMAKRAKQARTRRAKQKARLDTLKQNATAVGATEELKREYSIARKKRRMLLDYDKQRIAKRREKLKTDFAGGLSTALEKAEKIKKAKQLYYRESKIKGKENDWKAAQRSRKKFDMIKSKIEREGRTLIHVA